MLDVEPPATGAAAAIDDHVRINAPVAAWSCRIACAAAHGGASSSSELASSSELSSPRARPRRRRPPPSTDAPRGTPTSGACLSPRGTQSRGWCPPPAAYAARSSGDSKSRILTPSKSASSSSAAAASASASASSASKTPSPAGMGGIKTWQARRAGARARDRLRRPHRRPRRHHRRRGMAGIKTWRARRAARPRASASAAASRARARACATTARQRRRGADVDAGAAHAARDLAVRDERRARVLIEAHAHAGRHALVDGRGVPPPVELHIDPRRTLVHLRRARCARRVSRSDAAPPRARLPERAGSSKALHGATKPALAAVGRAAPHALAAAPRATLRRRRGSRVLFFVFGGGRDHRAIAESRRSLRTDERRGVAAAGAWETSAMSSDDWWVRSSSVSDTPFFTFGGETVMGGY